MGADSTPAALPRRPEARAFSVEDLVLAVLSGQIRVPIFQRNFRWELADVLALLDSIDRGYPIGSVLLWKRPARSEHLVHGSVVVDAPERHDALWVVDGHQRILSLTRVLAGKGHPDEPLAVFYDLETRSFKHLPTGESPSLLDLPLHALLDPYRLHAWIDSRYDATIDAEAVLALSRRLREYQIPAYVVATDDERTVREIFRRANKTGKSLDDSEVFHGLYSHAGPSPASLRDVARSLDDLAFGPLDEDTLLNMLLATRGAELPKERVPDLAPDEAHHAMIDLERSARAAITFLRHDAGIPHISLLPYTQPLLALARFFHLHREPHPRTRELLARWLWRGAVTGTHTGAALQTRHMLAAIDGSEYTALQLLLRTIPRSVDEAPALDTYSFSHARSKVHLLALLDLDPLDLASHEPVTPSPDDLARKDGYKHLVRTILPRTTVTHGGLADRIFHHATPSGIAAAIVACEDPGILATHAISPDARFALKFDRFDEFLRLRRDRLERHIEDFIARRTEWDEPDTPPVELLHLRAHE